MACVPCCEGGQWSLEDEPQLSCQPAWVPNTTHMTQEIDELYGPFKTQFLENLDLICEARLQKNVSLSLQPMFVGLPLFGGTGTKTSCNIEVSAFKQSMSKCVQAFEGVGAAIKDGVNRACLQDMQDIRMRSIGDGDNEADMLQHVVETANNTAVHYLIQAGRDVQYLTATLIKKV